jgi:hypothetical protein
MQLLNGNLNILVENNYDRLVFILCVPKRSLCDKRP